MTHVRTLVRNYVLNKLRDGDETGTFATAAENRVFDSKVTPNKRNFPVVSAYTTKDARDSILSRSPYEQKRVITLEIQCEVLAASTDYAKKLDDLCLQVENRIDYMLGGEIDAIESCEYNDTTTVFKDDGELITAIGLITYDVTYITDEAGLIDPGKLSKLSKFYTEWQLDGDTAKADDVSIT